MTEFDVLGVPRSSPGGRRGLRRLVEVMTTASLIVLVGGGVALAATVTVTPNPDSVNHPGGIVTYDVEVACEDAGGCELQTISVEGLGDCTAAGTPAFTTGDPYTCSFNEFVTGPAGSTQDRTVSATGLENIVPFNVSGSGTVSVTGTPFSGLQELIKAYVGSRVEEAFDRAGISIPEGSGIVTGTNISRAEFRAAIRGGRRN